MAVTDLKETNWLSERKKKESGICPAIKISVSGPDPGVWFMPVAEPSYKTGKFDKDLYDELESSRLKKFDDARKAFRDRFELNIAGGKQSPFYSVTFEIQPLEAPAVTPPEKDDEE
jgi:hypothetical protein